MSDSTASASSSSSALDTSDAVVASVAATVTDASAAPAPAQASSSSNADLKDMFSEEAMKRASAQMQAQNESKPKRKEAEPSSDAFDPNKETEQPPAKKQKTEDGAKPVESKQSAVQRTHATNSDISHEDGGSKPDADDDDAENEDDVLILTMDEFDPEHLTFDETRAGKTGEYLTPLYKGRQFLVEQRIWTPSYDLLAAPTSAAMVGKIQAGPGSFKIGVGVYGKLEAQQRAIHERIKMLVETGKIPSKFKLKEFDLKTKKFIEYPYAGFIRKTGYKEKKYNEIVKKTPERAGEIPEDAEQWENINYNVKCHRGADLKVCKILETETKEGDKTIVDYGFIDHEFKPMPVTAFEQKKPYDVLWKLNVSSSGAQKSWGASCKVLRMQKPKPYTKTAPRFSSERKKPFAKK